MSHQSEWLRLRDLLAIVPFGRNALIARIEKDGFPRPIKFTIGPNRGRSSNATTCWRRSDVLAYLERKAQESQDLK